MTVMAVTVRPYREEDRAALLRCMSALQHYIAGLDPLKTVRDLPEYDGEAYVARLLERVAASEGAIFLAETDGRVVGCVVGIVIEQNDDDLLETIPSRDARMLELYVDPEFQRQGAASSLVSVMEKFFRERGCATLRVECFAPNKGAYEFYRDFGFEDWSVYLLKKL